MKEQILIYNLFVHTYEDNKTKQCTTSICSVKTNKNGIREVQIDEDGATYFDEVVELARKYKNNDYATKVIKDFPTKDLSMWIEIEAISINNEQPQKIVPFLGIGKKNFYVTSIGIFFSSAIHKIIHPEKGNESFFIKNGKKTVFVSKINQTHI